MLLAALPILLSISPPAHAKDLRGRIGAGVDTQLGDIPAASVRFGLPSGNPAINIQAEVDFGFASYSSQTNQMVAGGRVLYGVVVEDNLNLYLGAGAALQTQGKVSVVRIQPAAVADFFLFGLENLGLSAGVGLNLDVGTGNSGLGTQAAVLTGAHYWF